MIILDLETSGLSLEKSGIWQIGAIDTITKEEFLDEAKIDDEDEISQEALKIIGKTEEYLRDSSKQSQKQMIVNFLGWVEKRKHRNFLCQNPMWDLGWLTVRMGKYGLKKTFGHRSFDLHTIAQTKYKETYGKFLLKDDGKSDMNLSKILGFCGLEDKRMLIHYGEVVQEGAPHNALEDCKIEGECFSRLIEGKNLFPEFSQYEIPEVLRK